MVKNIYGLTPILIAAGACGGRQNVTVLDFLLERDNISTIEKIDAMELAGASILCDPGNTTLFPKAFDYWIRATHHRQKKKKRFHPYRKTLQENSGGPVEWITWDQLERVIQHPSEYCIQSILMKLRILSSRSCAAVDSFLVDYFRGSVFNNTWAEGNFVELFFIHGAMMDTLLPLLPRENRAWRSAVLVINTFVQTLWILMRSNHTLFNLETIKRSLLFILTTDKLRLSDVERDEVFEASYTKALFSFLKLLLGFSETLKWDWIHQLFRQWGPHQLGAILLLACKEWQKSENYKENYFKLIRLLLKVGAVPDAIDQNGNGPIHIVAQTNHQQSAAVGCLLLGFGANLHRSNNAGKTAMDLWIERNEKESDEKAARLRHRPDWCRAVPKLQCLGGRCVRAHHVPYSKLPTVLHSFVENH